MIWQYSGDPTDSPKDAVRYMIGDTDWEHKLLSDPEIEYELAKTEQDPYRAAMECCLRLIAKFSRDVDNRLGPRRIDASQRVTHYRRLYEELKERYRSQHAVPTGSPSDPNSKPPIFDKGMFDNKGGYPWTHN